MSTHTHDCANSFFVSSSSTSFSYDWNPKPETESENRRAAELIGFKVRRDTLRFFFLLFLSFFLSSNAILEMCLLNRRKEMEFEAIFQLIDSSPEERAFQLDVCSPRTNDDRELPATRCCPNSFQSSSVPYINDQSLAKAN